MKHSKYYLAVFMLLVSPLLLASHSITEGGMMESVIGYFSYAALLSATGMIITKIILWTQR